MPVVLCRSDPDTVAPAARLLRERMLIARAGEGWSVLVPEGGPWRRGAKPVDRVVTGWATALGVGAPWPVLGLWWDADRAGYTLAAGFRRPVGYIWLADGTPAGEDEAMRTFAARLGLDPVLDTRSLERLTRPEAGADARARVRGLLAVLTRTGLALPAELRPGDPADRLREAARARRGTRDVEGEADERAEGAERDAGSEGTAVEWGTGGAGRWTTVLGERGGVRRARAGARLLPWLPWSGTPQARALALAQLVAAVPLAAWGLRHRGGGWVTAGAVLCAHGALGQAYDLTRPRG